MDDLLTPRPHPPSLARLAGSRALRLGALLRTVWRARRNLLHLVHPEIVDHAYLVDVSGPARMITVNDAGLARHVLLGAEDAFVKAPLYQALLGDVLGGGSILLEGAAARTRRRILAPAFNARAMARLEALVARRVAETVEGWLRADGPVDLSADCARMAMGVVLEAFFGADLGPRLTAVAQTLDRLFIEASTPALADLIGLGAWAPRRSRAAVRAAVAEIDAELYALIDRRAAEGGYRSDLLDRLRAARDPETGQALDRRALRDETMTLFLAGHETTALSLAWGLDRLAREPEVADRLAADPTLADTAYEEILRLHPPAWMIAREAARPTQWRDLAFRAGDRVQIPIYLLHRNRRYWTEPQRFEPSRFDGPPPAAYMPFGLGPRACVGMALARMEGRAALRAVARLRLTPAGPPPRPVGRITLRSAAPIRVHVAPR